MEQRSRLEDLGNRIWNAQRTEMFLEMRFLGAALGSLGYKMDLATQTVGTDAAFIRFNPQWTFNTYLDSPRKLDRAYMHMLMHCLFRHMFSASEEAHDNVMVWDLASDIAAEAAVDSMDYPCLWRITSDLREEWYDRLKKAVGVLTAEKIYSYLLEEFFDSGRTIGAAGPAGSDRNGQGSAQAADPDGADEDYKPAAALHPFKSEALGDLFEKLANEFRVDDHSFWSRLPKERKDPEMPEPKMPDIAVRRSNKEDEWEKTAKRVEAELKNSKLASNETGSFDQVLQFTLRRRTSLSEYIRKFTVLREETEIDPDSFDYGLYNFGMEFYGNMPLIEENEFREERRIEELVIAIDTSGSTQAGLVRRFLDEIASVLSDRESFFHRVNLHIIECDDQVQRDEVITDMDQLRRYAEGFTVSGGFGTDFRPVFRYVDDLIRTGNLKNLRGLLYFTDGYGIYPSKPTPYETAFVFFPGSDSSDTDVPDWAVKIYTE
jgi:predicted metal-dependent peptidase